MKLFKLKIIFKESMSSVVQKLDQARPEYPTITLKPNLLHKVLHPSKALKKSKACR